MTESLRTCDTFPLSQQEVDSAVSLSTTVTPPAMYTTARLLSIPGALPGCSWAMATLISASIGELSCSSLTFCQGDFSMEASWTERLSPKRLE